jgi:hypothetical protein
VGAVIELSAGVPANWMVLVVGVIVDWAFAEKVANAMKTAMQSKTAADFPRKIDLPGANVTALIEGLTLAFPSRKPWLPGSFADIQKKASSNCPARFTSGSAVKIIYVANQRRGFLTPFTSFIDFKIMEVLNACASGTEFPSWIFILQSKEE